MRNVTFRTEIFKTPKDRARGEFALNLYLETLFKLDVAYLRDYPDSPKIYESGTVYRPEPVGEENWKTIPIILTDGFGDCEDLACWRAAELYAEGNRHVRPVAIAQPTGTPGFTLFHIVVRGGGVREDPSKRLGMRGRA